MKSVMTFHTHGLKVAVLQCQVRTILKVLYVMDECCPSDPSVRCWQLYALRLRFLDPSPAFLAFEVVTMQNIKTLHVPLLRTIEGDLLFVCHNQKT